MYTWPISPLALQVPVGRQVLGLERRGIGPRLLAVARRSVRGEACWLAVGAVVGVCEYGKMQPGVVEFVAMLIAGMIVLGGVGVPITLLGGRGRDALGGALLGLMVGLGNGIAQAGAFEPLTSGHPVIVGALAATTGWPIVRGIVHVLAQPLRWLLPPLAAQAVGVGSEQGPQFIGSARGV